MLGQRDPSGGAFNVGSLEDAGCGRGPLDDVAATRRRPPCGRRPLVPAAERWWLHVDLDVLDPGVRRAGPARGRGRPGGLSWQQLTDLPVAAVGAGGCIGLSLAIYDPEQDPDGTGADAIVDLASTLAGGLTG